MSPVLENNISVIIPVYNAAPFVSKAVESALSQNEVAEVILIEDGSKDDSFEICRQLARMHKNVRLFTHPNNVNRGAGFSRNVGIQNSTTDYIAFLDADDYFLPDRFKAEREIFKNKPNIDGVYGALGFHFYSDIEKNKYPEHFYSLTTIPHRVPPEELFLSMLWLNEKGDGCIHVNTLTVKRNIFFGRTPLFNNLEMHEDTVFLLQLALNCNIEPGIIDKPVGMRGVHDNNRITKNPENSKSKLLMWEHLLNWSVTTSRNNYLQKYFQACFISEKIKHVKRISAIRLFIKHSIENSYFLTMGIFFNPSCLVSFGQHISKLILFIKVRIQARFFKKSSFIKNCRKYLIQRD